MWAPVLWLARARSYQALRELTSTDIHLWFLLFSTWPDYKYGRPLYYNRKQLAETLGKSVRSVTRSLAVLRDHCLLLEVDRGEEPKSRRHLPPARFPLDPFADEVWRPAVENALVQIAEEDGQGTHWCRRAIEDLDDFHKRSCGLRNRLEVDMPFKPKRRRKPKGRKKKQTARTRTTALPKMAHRGRDLPGVERRAVEVAGAEQSTNGSTAPEKSLARKKAAHTEPT